MKQQCNGSENILFACLHCNSMLWKRKRVHFGSELKCWILTPGTQFAWLHFQCAKLIWWWWIYRTDFRYTEFFVFVLCKCVCFWKLSYFLLSLSLFRSQNMIENSCLFYCDKSEADHFSTFPLNQNVESLWIWNYCDSSLNYYICIMMRCNQLCAQTRKSE